MQCNILFLFHLQFNFYLVWPLKLNFQQKNVSKQQNLVLMSQMILPLKYQSTHRAYVGQNTVYFVKCDIDQGHSPRLGPLFAGLKLYIDLDISEQLICTTPLLFFL